MMHGLAGIVTAVGDDAVAAGQSLLRGELRNDLKALGNHSGVFRRDGRDRVDALAIVDDFVAEKLGL